MENKKKTPVIWTKKRERRRRRRRRKKKKKKLAQHEKFEETVFNGQRIFQLTSGQQVHAKLARAQGAKDRRRNIHKEKKTFSFAWNNHDCLWPSSMWPVSLARSWSSTHGPNDTDYTDGLRLAARLRHSSFERKAARLSLPATPTIEMEIDILIFLRYFKDRDEREILWNFFSFRFIILNTRARRFVTIYIKLRFEDWN